VPPGLSGLVPPVQVTLLPSSRGRFENWPYRPGKNFRRNPLTEWAYCEGPSMGLRMQSASRGPDPNYGQADIVSPVNVSVDQLGLGPQVFFGHTQESLAALGARGVVSVRFLPSPGDVPPDLFARSRLLRWAEFRWPPPTPPNFRCVPWPRHFFPRPFAGAGRFASPRVLRRPAPKLFYGILLRAPLPRYSLVRFLSFFLPCWGGF